MLLAARRLGITEVPIVLITRRSASRWPITGGSLAKFAASRRASSLVSRKMD